MRVRLVVGTAASTLLLAGCVSYHQEGVALRMQRPASDAALAPFAAASADYPSVGGDILRVGGFPAAAAAR